MKLKELRKMRRKERKDLEIKLGLRSDTSVGGIKGGRSFVGGHHSLPSGGGLERPHDLDLYRRPPDIVNSSQLVRDALRESMISFQVVLRFIYLSILYTYSSLSLCLSI